MLSLTVLFQWRRPIIPAKNNLEHSVITVIPFDFAASAPYLTF
jgi:hypothetical protein